MRTASKIFGILLFALGAAAAGCALSVPGADHQWYIAGICWLVAFALLVDTGNKIDSIERI